MGKKIDMERHVIALCGATGFVGSSLSRHFTAAGHRVVPLGRELFRDGAESELAAAMTECDTVINVAGATIDHRWSTQYKKVLYESRVGVARRLVAAIARTESVRCWVCVSAVGYYPSTGCHDESSSASGVGFLAELCCNWEAEALKVSERIRTIITRFGVVMGPMGGVFGRMALPARMGVAVLPGTGRQPFSWIDIDDLCRAMEWVACSSSSGVYNFTAPQRMTMLDAVRQVKKHYRAPMYIRIPEWLLHWVRGEAADPLVQGQCVLPARLLTEGFEFRTPDFETFLRRLSK